MMFNMRKQILQKIGVISILFLLTACIEDYSSNDNDIDGLISQSMSDVRNSKNITVDDLLPTIIEDEETIYGGIAYVDPFTTPKSLIVQIEEPPKAREVLPLKSDPTRPEGYVSEPLEAYDLQAITMIGAMGKSENIPFGESLSALLDIGEDRIISVNVGDYLGRNFGRIVNISEAEIEIEEKYATGADGDWVSRPAFINLRIND